MIRVVDSQLYKYLVFIRRTQSEYDVKEVFNLILGYQLALNQAKIPAEVKENWISGFNDFIEKKLTIKYYNGKIAKLPINYGEAIYENQQNSAEGLAEFFNILEEYRNIHD